MKNIQTDKIDKNIQTNKIHKIENIFVRAHGRVRAWVRARAYGRVRTWVRARAHGRVMRALMGVYVRTCVYMCV